MKAILSKKAISHGDLSCCIQANDLAAVGSHCTDNSISNVKMHFTNWNFTKAYLDQSH